SRLSGSQFLWQDRQLFIPNEKIPLGHSDFMFWIEVEIEIALQGRLSGLSFDRGRELILSFHVLRYGDVWHSPRGGDSSGDFFIGTEQKQRTPQMNAVARPQPANLHDIAVHPRSIGAFQVGENNVAVVLLHFGMESAHPLVIESKAVAFLSPNRHRWRQ